MTWVLPSVSTVRFFFPSFTVDDDDETAESWFKRRTLIRKNLSFFYRLKNDIFSFPTKSCPSLLYTKDAYCFSCVNYICASCFLSVSVSRESFEFGRRRNEESKKVLGDNICYITLNLLASQSLSLLCSVCCLFLCFFLCFFLCEAFFGVWSPASLSLPFSLLFPFASVWYLLVWMDILFLSFLRLPSNDILFSHFLEISHLHLHVCLWSFFLLLPFILSVFLYHLPSLVSYFLLLHPSQILLSRVKWEKDGGGREDGSRSQKDWNVQGGWKQVSLFFNEKSSQEGYNKGMKEGK